MQRHFQQDGIARCGVLAMCAAATTVGNIAEGGKGPARRRQREAEAGRRDTVH